MKPNSRSVLIHVFLAVVVVSISAGCSLNSSTRNKTTDTGVLDAEKVLAIAREAVEMNDTWVDQAEFEDPKQEADGSWGVMVWRLPKTPGGHRLIHIDASGKVVDYFRGR